MNSNNLLKQKKGISPIIATLLLILIAIAAGVIVYAYVVGFIGASTSNSGGTTDTLSIDQVALSSKSTSFPVTAYVRNEGPTTDSFNSGFFVKGSSLNDQLVPAISIKDSGSATGSDTVSNVTISSTGTAGQILVSVLYSACATTAGTASVSIFGSAYTSLGGACTTSAAVTITLSISGMTFTGAPAGVGGTNVATVASITDALTNNVASVVGMNPVSGASISVAVNNVGTFTLALSGVQATNPLSAGSTYTVQATGTDGASTTASAKAS